MNCIDKYLLIFSPQFLCNIADIKCCQFWFHTARNFPLKPHVARAWKDKEPELSEPKTPNSRRRIELTTQAIQALKTHKATQAEEKLKLGENWQDHGLVFCSEIGTHVRHENLLRRSYRGILIKAELPYRNFHNLRHSAATHLLKQNIHPKIVSEMLGHSHIGITMDLYSHCTPDMQKQAAEAMQSIFEG